MARLLVVDDRADFADSLALMLQVHDHETCVCYSGNECLKAFEEFKPDAVRIDLWMPHPDGIEVAKRLRDQVPIILISGVTGSLGPDASLFACRLMKPVNTEELLLMAQEKTQWQAGQLRRNSPMETQRWKKSGPALSPIAAPTLWMSTA